MLERYWFKLLEFKVAVSDLYTYTTNPHSKVEVIREMAWNIFTSLEAISDEIERDVEMMRENKSCN